uniref:Uncharacterized protein n=1 Tax=Amphora coffeiformis TaxID=265554 RepID=A0A7S3L5M6_9STRA|eukprot:scaffold34622_cov162-Amphora_coffeaeformis.AAC.11
MELLKREEDGLSLSDDQQLEALTATSVANLMREQDADLLASHHALGANEPDPSGTPMRESLPAMIRDVPNLILGASEEGPLCGPNTPASGETVLMAPPQVSEHKRRPTLSGQVFLTDPEKTSPVVVDEVETSRGDHHRRSESMDRRLSEAAQFAAAVGAEAVTGEIRIIDNYYEDDEDDESDKGKKEDNNSTHQETCSVDSALGMSAGGASCLSLDKVISSEPSRPAASSSALTTRLSSGVMVGRPHKPVIATKRGFMDQLPGGDLQPTFIYKGIHSNPPEIVQRGIQRGNYAQLHRKAWLEVSDKYHRYGKNLRLYYRYWEKLGCPFNMFFDWLDSKGEAAGHPLPELEKCPRAQLDSDVVLYISNPDVTEKFAIGIVVHGESGAGLMVDNDGDPIVTGPDGWIFVLRDNRLYGAQKITSVTGERSKERFHHSSFFGGKAVEAAGIFITDDKGYLTQLLPHSGHYRPGESHMQRVLFFLHHMGVDLRTFDMDMQQILHVARDTETGDDGKVEKMKEKKKKIESLCLQPAVLVACFLAHKARFIGNGVFKQIHKIKNAPVTNVTEALEFIDDGGCW